MCFIFHKWNKWEQYKQKVKISPGILYPKEIRGKVFETIEKRQRRTCKECGKMQDIVVTGD